ncbi:MAG: hypothetical protein U1F06_00725 [Steroidobacteraceae bacterium]
MGQLTMPVREKLDNLVFVINCNLQRLDGPVRAGGTRSSRTRGRVPRRRLERHQGHLGLALGPAAGARHQGLQQVMEQCVDGEYQNFKAKGSAYARPLLRQEPDSRKWSPTCRTTTSGGAEPRRP